MKFKSDIEVQAGLKDSSGSAGTSGQMLISTATGVSWSSQGGYVPYTGATGNVNLGNYSLSAYDLIINHSSGSGVAASITKGGNGEALTVVKTSGSGNAASITGGVTLISELNLTTDLADAYIASAVIWNAKQNALNGTGFVKISGTTISYDNSAYVPTSRTITINGVTQDLSANQTWTIAGGVTSFNTRTGAITLTSGDVTTALGYTPVTDARTITINGVTQDLAANRSWTVTAPETDTLATVTARGASTNTLSSFNGGLTATKTAKNTYGIQIKGGFYGAPRLQLYDLAIDTNAFVGLGVDMSGAGYEFSNYFPRTGGNGRWSVGSWAGDFGTGQYVSGYNEKLWINESGAQFNVSLTDTVDMRAPIFYDSNNTGYYGDFAGTSKLNNLQVATLDSAITWTNNTYMMGSPTHGFRFNDNGSNINALIIDNSGNTFAHASHRAPIFYDSNNTGYYGDFASSGTSLSINGGIVTTAASGSILLYHQVAEANAWLFRENAPNWGLFWFNNGTQSGQVIGSYTTIGAELFGTNNGVGGFNPNSAWTGTNADTRASWMLSNYTGYMWSNSTIYAAGDMRSPIYYDSNDTGYYIDPASTSNLNAVNFSTLYSNRSGASGNVIAIDNAGTGTWPFIFQTSAVGNDNASGFWVGAGGLPDMRLRKDDGTVRALISSWERSYTTYGLTDGTDMRAPVFYDSNDTAYYVNPGDASRIRKTDIVAIGAGWLDALNIYSSDATNKWSLLPDAGASNSLRFAYNASEKFRVQTNGSVISLVEHQSPIYYDFNNTAYYLNPDGTSNTNLFTVNQLLFPSTTFNPATGPRNTEPMSVKMWNNYFNGTGLGSDYGTVMEYYSMSGHVASQVYFDAAGGSWYRTASYAAGWQGWQRYVTENGGTWGINITGNSGTTSQRSFNYLYGSSYLESGGAVYGTIFYDNDDRGWYVDPNSLSKIVKIWTGAPNGNSTAPRWDTSFYVMQSQHWYSHNGASTMYVGEAGDFVYIRGYSLAEGSFRAPVFYDSNNTAYYIDASGASNLYELQLTGASNKYLYINPGTGYEAMVRVQGGTGSSWYMGKRTSNTSQADTSGFHFYSDAGGDTVFGIDTSGTARAKGDVVAYSSSDKQLKDNIKPIENALEKVKQIGGYTFDWNDKQDTYKGHDVGIIAQEIEAVLPEVVITRDTGYKAVKYEKIVPLLIEAIKEQQTQIEELKELVNKLINKQ